MKSSLKDMRLGQLKTLRPVMAQWVRLNQQLGSDWIDYGDDAPWWYNERASLSLLAGAVWQSRGWAFEEFSTTKKAPAHHRTKLDLAGRCDIMFGIGKHVFIGEAKQCWPVLGTKPLFARKCIEKSLDVACEDCRRLPDWGYQRVGIVFAAPMLHQSKHVHIGKYLDEFVAELRRMPDAVMAWVFPKAARALRPSNKYQDYFFPGAVLIMRPLSK